VAVKLEVNYPATHAAWLHVRFTQDGRHGDLNLRPEAPFRFKMRGLHLIPGLVAIPLVTAHGGGKKNTASNQTIALVADVSHQSVILRTNVVIHNHESCALTHIPTASRASRLAASEGDNRSSTQTHQRFKVLPDKQAYVPVSLLCSETDIRFSRQQQGASAQILIKVFNEDHSAQEHKAVKSKLFGAVSRSAVVPMYPSLTPRHKSKSTTPPSASDNVTVTRTPLPGQESLHSIRADVRPDLVIENCLPFAIVFEAIPAPWKHRSNALKGVSKVFANGHATVRACMSPGPSRLTLSAVCPEDALVSYLNLE
jgi:hypothetical protein